MAYVEEGLGDLVDWDKAAAAYQRKNGSFFNSPATTAAAAIHSNNDRALDYLDTSSPSSTAQVQIKWVPEKSRLHNLHKSMIFDFQQ